MQSKFLIHIHNEYLSSRRSVEYNPSIYFNTDSHQLMAVNKHITQIQVNTLQYTR